MDPTLCRISAPSGAFNYQRKIRQFLWSHRSENETDLVIVSDEASVRVHGAVLLPLSDDLLDLLPPSCPCSKPAVCLPPFPRNVLAAAIEILYIGETAKLASRDDWIKIKQVFSLLRIKVDGVVGNFEGENIGGGNDHGEVDGGVILKIELDDMDDKNSVNPLDEQQINTYQQDIHKYNLNEVTGLFVCEKDNEEMNESINVKELEPRIRRDLKRRNVDILNKYDDSEEKQPSSFSQASKNVKESDVCGRQLDGKIISYASKTQTENKNQKICATAQSPKKYICCKCDYKTNRKNNFQKHFDRVHQKVSQNCSHCDFKTTHEFYLQRHTIKKHTASVHQKIYHCEQCDFKTTWQENLKKHINGVHGNIDYHCDQCDYKTKWKANLKIHIKSVHENSAYLCNQCDYNTKWKANLRIHINGAHEKIFHPCNLCDYKTKWKTHLRRHILGVHENMSVEGPLLSSTPPPGNSKKYPQLTRKHMKTKGKCNIQKHGDCQAFNEQRDTDDAHAEDSSHKVAGSTKSDNPGQISDETFHKRSVINWKEKGKVLPCRKKN